MLDQRHPAIQRFSLNFQEISHKSDLNSYFRNLSPWILLSFLEMVEAKSTQDFINFRNNEWHWVPFMTKVFMYVFHKLPVKSDLLLGERNIHWVGNLRVWQGAGLVLHIHYSDLVKPLREHGEVATIFPIV